MLFLPWGLGDLGAAGHTCGTQDARIFWTSQAGMLGSQSRALVVGGWFAVSVFSFFLPWLACLLPFPFSSHGLLPCFSKLACLLACLPACLPAFLPSWLAGGALRVNAPIGCLLSRFGSGRRTASLQLRPRSSFQGRPSKVANLGHAPTFE